MYKNNGKRVECAWIGMESAQMTILKWMRKPHWTCITRAKMRANRGDISRKSGSGSGNSPAEDLVWDPCGWNRMIWGKGTKSGGGELWEQPLDEPQYAGPSSWMCSPNGTISRSSEVQYQFGEDSKLNYWSFKGNTSSWERQGKMSQPGREIHPDEPASALGDTHAFIVDLPLADLNNYEWSKCWG